MDTSIQNSRFSTAHRIRKLAGRLTGLEIWVVGTAAAAGFLSARLLPFAPLAALVFCLLRLVAEGRLFRRTPADAAILLLALTVPVTLWVTLLPEVTYPQVYRLLTGMALYYAIVDWAGTRRCLRLVAYGIALAAILLALGALIGVEWPDGRKIPLIPASIYAHFPLLVADPANPNVMAGVLVILAPVLIALPLFAWRKQPRAGTLLFLCGAALAGGVLAITQSRGAMLAAAAVFALLILLRWRRGWLALGLITLLGAAVLYGLGPARALNFFVTNATLGGVDGREEVWSRAVYMIQDFPLTGIGMGSFTRVADTLYPFSLYSPGKIMHAHNLFLQIGADLGIPGLIAWLGVFFLAAWQSFRLYRQGRAAGDSWIAGLGAGLLSSQAALAVHGMLDAVTWGMVRPAVFVWVLWGLAAAAFNACMNPAREAQDLR